LQTPNLRLSLVRRKGRPLRARGCCGRRHWFRLRRFGPRLGLGLQLNVVITGRRARLWHRIVLQLRSRRFSWLLRADWRNAKVKAFTTTHHHQPPTTTRVVRRASRPALRKEAWRPVPESTAAVTSVPAVCKYMLARRVMRERAMRGSNNSTSSS
jgi:hypothetical protein